MNKIRVNRRRRAHLPFTRVQVCPDTDAACMIFFQVRTDAWVVICPGDIFRGKKLMGDKSDIVRGDGLKTKESSPNNVLVAPCNSSGHGRKVPSHGRSIKADNKSDIVR